MGIPRPESKAQAEGKSLIPDYIESSGRVAMPRAQGSIDGDTALAIFDDGPWTNRMTLVKVNNQWYVAGNEILAVYP